MQIRKYNNEGPPKIIGGFLFEAISRSFSHQQWSGFSQYSSFRSYLTSLRGTCFNPGYSSAINLFLAFFFCCAVPPWIASMVINIKPLRDFYKHASISLTISWLICKSIFTSSLSSGEGPRVRLPPLQSSSPPSPQERE